ncbi:serine hydrolase domain-containing protein [Phaeobacter marinintestinus]|uniref:serine hydrolase domain-containing protein n=1 Tax=Falsiphaeobacter marinintestinus TaxID=1492905 RepID=UPI0011B72D33|nr:serine hydrolase domain-containing protein [Phaeobacter marinintestinus]
MTKLDDVLADAVTARQVPFAVAMTGTASGITYCGAAGEAAAGRLAGEDTVFRIYSMTKAIGSVAAMILIDRGLLSPDTPVGDILPAWNDLPVLDGWDGDTPVLRPQKTVATIRHLATHSSGMAYEFWNPDVLRYLEATGIPTVMSGKRAGLNYPLASDPGTQWGYGGSIDWLGQIVEAVDGRRIDAFCYDEILGPLGMTDTRFEPDGLEDRLADVSMRVGADGFRPTRMGPPKHPEFYGMGHALYSTAPDYMAFLRMVLNRGTLNGVRILSDDAWDLLANDQMQGLTFAKMTAAARGSTDVDYPGRTMTHSFAFLRNEEPWRGKRSAGSLGWAGICNTHYWIDPARDLCAVLMTQSLPFIESPFLQAYDAFERAVYAEL